MPVEVFALELPVVWKYPPNTLGFVVPVKVVVTYRPDGAPELIVVGLYSILVAAVLVPV